MEAIIAIIIVICILSAIFNGLKHWWEKSPSTLVSVILITIVIGGLLFLRTQSQSIRNVVAILLCGTISLVSIGFWIRGWDKFWIKMVAPATLAMVFFVGSIVYHLMPGGMKFAWSSFLIFTFVVPIIVVLKGALGTLIAGFGLCAMVIGILNGNSYLFLWHEIMEGLAYMVAGKISPFLEWTIVITSVAFNATNWTLAGEAFFSD